MQQQLDVCYGRWAARADGFIGSLYGQEPNELRGVWRAALPPGRDGLACDSYHSALRSLVQICKNYLACRCRRAHVAEHAAWLRAMWLAPKPADFCWAAVRAQVRQPLERLMWSSS